MKLLTTAIILMLFTQLNIHGNEVNNCNAPVTIPEQGVTIKLQQGEKKFRYLDVALKGIKTNAIVDTGGMGIGGLISEDIANSLAIDNQSLNEITANGAHGAGKNKIATIPTTSIGDASVANLMFMITEKSLTVEEDVTSQALIGSRFLCQFLVEFNFAEDTLSFYNRNTDISNLVENKKQWVSVAFENFYNTGGIIFPVQLNGKTVKAALDTGSPYTGINWKAAKLAGIDQNSDKLRQYKVKAHGLNAKGSVMVNEAKFNLSLPKGQLSRFDNEVRINDIHAFKQLFGDKPGMILGLPFFEQRRLVIDYANSNLYFSEQQKGATSQNVGS